MRRSLWFLFLIAHVCVLATAEARAARVYSVTEIPRGSFAALAGRDLNDAGHVVGAGGTTGSPGLNGVGFFWSPETGMVEVGARGSTIPMALNNHDTVVGMVNTPTGNLPFTWNPQDRTVRQLDSPNGSGVVDAYDVNDAGQLIVKTFSINSTFNSVGAVRDPDGTYRTLPALRPGDAIPRAINAGGDVVGLSLFQGFTGDRAAYWPAQGGIRRLIDPAGLRSSEALAVNACGEAAGTGTATDGGRRALFWPASGSGLDLGTLAGADEAFTEDLNNLGEVVGDSGLRSASASRRAFVWTAADGMLDLNTLLDPSGPDWTLRSATSVNNRGQILATGVLNGQPALALLTPVPEPGAIGGCVVVVVGILGRRRRR